MQPQLTLLPRALNRSVNRIPEILLQQTLIQTKKSEKPKSRYARTRPCGQGRQNYQGRGHNYHGRNTPYDQQHGGRYGPYRGGRNNYQGRGSRFGGHHYNQCNPSSDNSYFSRSEWDALSNQERQDALHARSQRHLESLHNGDNTSVISQITMQTNPQVERNTGSIAQVTEEADWQWWHQ